MIRDGHTLDVVGVVRRTVVVVEGDVIHGRDLKIRWIGLGTFGRACVIVAILECSWEFSRLILDNPSSKDDCPFLFTTK